jgi:serine/threonine protein kinase
MAMPIYHGRTLKAVRQADGAPDEAWLRGCWCPLLDAIETLHAAGVYHRDIAPDNILLEADGRPVLLDFGAARRVLGDRSQTLTAILKPAYAPIEQYAEASSARQGPWTDLYALGATLHYLLIGVPPPPATARTLHDDLVPLAQRALPGFSPACCVRSTGCWSPARPTDRRAWPRCARCSMGGPLPPPVLALAAGTAWWLWRPVSVSNPVLAAQPVASVPVIVTAIVPAIVPASAAVPLPAAAPAMHEVPARVAEPAREAVLEPARPVPTPVRPATVRHDPPPARDSVVTPTPSLVPADAQPVLPATSSPLASSPAQIISRTPVPTAAALSDDASAICGSRVLLALFWCMERKCASADFKDHPACRKWFASNRQRPSP